MSISNLTTHSPCSAVAGLIIVTATLLGACTRHSAVLDKATEPSRAKPAAEVAAPEYLPAQFPPPQGEIEPMAPTF